MYATSLHRKQLPQRLLPLSMIQAQPLSRYFFDLPFHEEWEKRISAPLLDYWYYHNWVARRMAIFSKEKQSFFAETFQHQDQSCSVFLFACSYKKMFYYMLSLQP